MIRSILQTTKKIVLQRSLNKRWSNPKSATQRTFDIKSLNFNFEIVTALTEIKDRSIFGHKNEPRIHNMKRAIDILNDHVIHHENYFSFWALIPYPNKSNGFLPGPTLVNEQLKQEYGGGLCQVSTTLFLAFLKGGFKIVERHPHSVDTYGETRMVPLGEDATVAYGYKNLIVQNPFNHPVQIKMELEDNNKQLKIAIFGTKSPLRKYTIVHSKPVEIPPLTSHGSSGWIMNTKRVESSLRETSAFKKETYFARDHYKPS